MFVTSRFRHTISLRVDDGDCDRDIRALVPIIADLRSHAHSRRCIRDLRCRHLQTPMGDMDRLAYGHAHFAIDPGSGIPARAVIARIRLDGNHVRLTKLHKRCSVYAKRHVPIIPATSQLAIHVDFGKGHHAIKVQKDLAAPDARLSNSIVLRYHPTPRHGSFPA